MKMSPKWEFEFDLDLLTPEQVKALPDNTALISINGNCAITGVDYVDLDTRFGYTAWAILPRVENPSPEDRAELMRAYYG